MFSHLYQSCCVCLKPYPLRPSLPASAPQPPQASPSDFPSLLPWEMETERPRLSSVAALLARVAASRQARRESLPPPYEEPPSYLAAVEMGPLPPR